MPAVAFHTGLPDKIGYTCRLLRKAVRQGLRVRVIAEAAELELLDKALWAFDPHDFVAHVRVAAGVTPPANLRRTPVWLTHDAGPWAGEPAAGQVLVNLGLPPPDDAAAYARVIELVSDERAERGAGRERWRHYEAHGFTMEHFPGAEGP